MKVKVVEEIEVFPYDALNDLSQFIHRLRGLSEVALFQVLTNGEVQEYLNAALGVSGRDLYAK